MSEAAAVAATPSNFDAHLASVDMSGPDDGGMQDVRDSTGPSNTNAMREQPRRSAESATPQIEREAQEHTDPEYRVGDDGQPLELDENGFEVQQDQEQDESEEQPDGVPAYEELQEMFRVTQGPELHEYFLQKTVPTPVNGVTVPKTVEELRAGYMRMSDYSRGKQEAAEEIKQARQVVERNQQLFQRMTDPKVLRATLRRLGPQYERAFHVAAWEHAQEFVAYKNAPPSERAAIDRAREMERRAELAEEAARRQPPQEQTPQQHPHYEPIHQSLQQLVPDAFARHGVRPSPIATQAFQAHIAALWDGQLESIADVVEQATIATAEELGERVQQHQQFLRQQQSQQPQFAPQQRPQALPPQRMPGGPPPRTGGPQLPAGRARVSDFDAHIRGLR